MKNPPSFPAVDTSRMAKSFTKHASKQERESTLELPFRYLDQLSIPEKPYIRFYSFVDRKEDIS